MLICFAPNRSNEPEITGWMFFYGRVNSASRKFLTLLENERERSSHFDYVKLDTVTHELPQEKNLLFPRFF